MSAYSYAFGFTTGDSISNKIVWKNNHPENPLDIFWGATQYVFNLLPVAPQINIVSLWKINYHTCLTMYLTNPFQKIHKKWCFPLMVVSVNVNKSVFCGFGLIYWRNHSRKTSFFCAVFSDYCVIFLRQDLFSHQL